MRYALCVGEMLIDFIPAPAGPDGTLCYQPHPGGAPANAAVALARLGGSVRFLGKLGEDAFGRLLLHILQENGVDTSYVPTTAQGNTTLVLVTLQDDGQREFTFYRQQTADTLLDVDDLNELVWEDVALCHAGSLSLSVEPARTATRAALEQARQRGLLVSFDVNARLSLWNSEEELRATLASVIANVDLLKCSAEEAHLLDSELRATLDPSDSPGLLRLGRRLLERGPSLVIITRGPLGALLLTSRHALETPASTLRALDTTGAGDAFMGAILRRLMEHYQITRESLAALDAQDLRGLGEFANKVAGISCTRYGGIASLPSLAEVEQA